MGFSNFLHRPKSYKKASRSLNSPSHSACFWRSVSLSRLVGFQILFLEHDLFPRVLLCPKPKRPLGSDNKERHGLSLFEMISLYITTVKAFFTPIKGARG